MLELAASIREKGVVNPALVRPKPEGGYENGGRTPEKIRQ